MQISTSQRPIQYNQSVFESGRRESLRNSRKSIGDSRHTREMLQSDIPHLSATVHLSVSGLSAHYSQQLGSFAENGV